MAILSRKLAVALALVLVTQAAGVEAGVEPRLATALDELRPDEELPVIAVFAAQTDLEPFHRAAHGIRGGPAEISRRHRQALLSALKETSAAAAAPLISFLASRGVRTIEPLWVVNALAATAGREAIEALASWPGVSEVRLNATMRIPTAAVVPAGAVEWNLSAIHAPELWDLGYTGQGVVIATLDSGVDGLHADLGPRWRGGGNSWYDPYGEHPDLPFDSDGHGTAVMGVLVGGSAGGTAIGVAPDARWIAAKIFNDAGVADELRVHQGFQWLLDPDGDPATDDAPDVVNNSWGLEALPGTCATVFQADVLALRAAGIVTVFAAGNAGNLPASSLSPANYPESFAVGAVDQTSAVSSFSARGPSACDGSFFPEVVAPGAGIRTADLTLGGTFPVSHATFDGTSLAAPHVAGAMALLLSALPGQSAAGLEASLRQTATDVGSAGPDNSSGSGLINVLAAYDFLNVPPGTPRIAVLPSAVRFNFGSVPVGAAATGAFSVINAGSADLVIGAIAVGGAHAAEFSLANDLCTNGGLIPSAGCSFEVTFSPLTGGRKTAGLAIPSNDPGSPQTEVLLTGNERVAIGAWRFGAWFLDTGDGAWSSAEDVEFRSFGVPEDQPVAGDWDGDGRTEIGVWRGGAWYLDNGNGGWDPGLDIVYRSFGVPGDIPVTGDWDGDGRTEIGAWRRGTWYLDNGNGRWDPGIDAVHQSFGAPGDVPVTGDWDGDGRTEIGAWRGGAWYLDDGNGQWDAGTDTSYVRFGAPSDIPVTGDWDGDGRTEIGVYRRGTWYLDNGNGRWDPGVDTIHAGFGAPEDLPLTGRWR